MPALRHRVPLPRLFASATLLLGLLTGAPHAAEPATPAEPIVLGETFTLASTALAEQRRINVFRPTYYGEAIPGPLPVLYMPDGGMAEDFLHIAGLLQVSVSNGTVRPFLLVGIENTQRRRDLTGPTGVAKDREIAPVVGGSAAFRAFLRDELMPEIARHHAVTGERALIGESLAGLFVIETLMLEPALFDHYIAVDPSLWWNEGWILREAAALRAGKAKPAALFIAASHPSEIGELSARLIAAWQPLTGNGFRLDYLPLRDETHATIFHPAALRALRSLLAPPAR